MKDSTSLGWVAIALLVVVVLLVLNPPPGVLALMFAPAAAVQIAFSAGKWARRRSLNGTVRRPRSNLVGTGR